MFDKKSDQKTLEETPTEINERYEKLKADERKLLDIYDKLFSDNKKNVLVYASEKLELQELRR